MTPCTLTGENIDNEALKECVVVKPNNERSVVTSNVEGVMVEFSEAAKGSLKKVYMHPLSVPDLKELVVSQINMGPKEQFSWDRDFVELDLQNKLASLINTSNDTIIPRVVGITAFEWKRRHTVSVIAQVIAENATRDYYALAANLFRAGHITSLFVEDTSELAKAKKRFADLDKLVKLIRQSFVSPEEKKKGFFGPYIGFLGKHVRNLNPVTQIHPISKKKRGAPRPAAKTREIRNTQSSMVSVKSSNTFFRNSVSSVAEKNFGMFDVPESTRMWQVMYSFGKKGKGLMLGWLNQNYWIMDPLFRSLKMMHNLGYVHGDVKSDNFLVRKAKLPDSRYMKRTSYARLIDFGLTKPAAVWDQDIARVKAKFIAMHENDVKYKNLVNAVLDLPEKCKNHMLAREFITVTTGDDVRCLFMTNTLFRHFDEELSIDIADILYTWDRPEVKKLIPAFLEVVIPMRNLMIEEACLYYDMINSPKRTNKEKLREDKFLFDAEMFSKEVSKISATL